MKQTILIVDDAIHTLEVIQRNLEAQDYRVYTAISAHHAIELLETIAVDLVITDLKMPDVCGMDLVRHVRENYKDTQVMMITGYASIESAIEAVKIGAEEYLAKPFTDQELLTAVHRSLARRSSSKKLAEDKAQPRQLASPCGLLGTSKVMRRVYAAIAKCASSLATVLIAGESGTGKELVARAIHYNGKRASAPFIPINCGGIPEGLLESELFGCVKGAFTGANQTRQGFFQTAESGTIFLDEISETSLAMQVKLLRALQNKEVCQVGSSMVSKVDVRIIAATNKDLAALVGKGRFRQDLYYRLNVISIELPPLRERSADIALLAEHFLDKYAKELGEDKPQLSEESLIALQNYFWPGNVRELENVMQRLVVMHEAGPIVVADLPSFMRFSVARTVSYDRPLAEVEAEYIAKVLAGVGGNKTQAATILGIDRKTLREKLKKLPDKELSS